MHYSRKRFWFKLEDGTKVLHVDGNSVRRKHIQFVQGGHGYVYPTFIPKSEIWVERMLNKEDECAIAIHEITEQRLMKYRRMSYNNAHDHANRVELKVRRGKIKACKVLKQF